MPFNQPKYHVGNRAYFIEKDLPVTIISIENVDKPSPEYCIADNSGCYYHFIEETKLRNMPDTPIYLKEESK